MDIKKLLWIAILVSIVGIIIASLKPTMNIATNFGGAFTLTNHLGEAVTNKDFENQYRLIYFGFTYCPAICPTELQRINQVLKNLGDIGKNIQPIFITVDPERDTVGAMKSYVGLFHPRLIGLTGTQAQIDTIKKGYKVYSSKIQEENMTDYTVDHSSYIYFMGPNNTLIHLFKMDESVESITKKVKTVLEKSNLQ